MKRIFTFFTLAFFSFSLLGQVIFSDDFESYNAGDFIANSPDWTTWNNAPGSTTDAKISNEQAASGTNSLKIFATAAAGGPMDILLPFKGVYNTGRFVKTMKLYLPEGKEGYFNYQATTTPGTTWTLNGYLRPNGVFEFSNSANAILFTAKYPHGTWFEFTMDINLDLNIWNVIIDGECVGSFTNTTKNIASMNLYPNNSNSVFYVDDVSFMYDPVSPEINVDLGVTNVIYNGGKLAGSKSDVTYTLTNNGKTTINTAELEISVNEEKTNITYSDLAILPGKSTVLTLDEEITLIGGENLVSLNLISINGENSDDSDCNNSAKLFITAAVAAPGKAVLVEEATGTWCQWCPRGAVFMDRLSHLYEGLFIPIAVHNSDPMEVTVYDDFLAVIRNGEGYPSAAVNRKTVVDPSDLEAPFIANISEPALALLDAGVTYDESSKLMTAQVEVTFAEDVDSDFHLSLVITQDNMSGTSSSWAQSNAYAGGGSGIMGGYELLPSPVPASKMIYDHVARAIIGLNPDSGNTISGPHSKGEKVYRTFTYTLGSDAVTEEMYIIPILNQGSTYINAKELFWQDAITNGILSSAENNVAVVSSVKTFPNPASNVSNFEITLERPSEVRIELFDVTGKMIASADHGVMQGLFIVPINVAGLQNGSYVARIITEEESTTMKIVVQN